MTDELTSKATKDKWKQAFQTYTHRSVITLLFLGFSAGLPILLIFGTLSFWLARAGVEISTITYFSWAALGYSFKFIWAPLIDRLPLPVLDNLLGRRRSWLLVTQVLIAAAIIWMGLTEPLEHQLPILAAAAVLLGFSSASQDIVIDAYRIEIADQKYQAAMSAMYQAGYRIGMILASAGTLYLVAFFNGTDERLYDALIWSYSQGEKYYLYDSWRMAYVIIACFMSIGIATTLIMREPDKKAEVESFNQEIFNTTTDYIRFLFLFALTTAAFVLAFVYLNPSEFIFDLLAAHRGMYELAIKIIESDSDLMVIFLGQLCRLLIAFTVAFITARFLITARLVSKVMVVDTYVKPITDFTSRYKKSFIIILLLIGFYRISDIVLGVVALVFYEHLGFSEIDIANISKTFGLIMVIVGGFLGGLLASRYGVLKILLLGAVLAAATNILFMLLAQMGNNKIMFTLVIAADNLSAGLAGSAFIAYLSSLTNIKFTAMQYALFTSIMTLIPKLIAGYSGSMVANIGYESFFMLTAILGIPVILLTLYLIRHPELNKEHISNE